MLESIYKRIWEKRLWMLFLFGLFMLYGCGSDHDNSSPGSETLNVSGSDVALQGTQMQIEVSLGNVSQSGLKVGVSADSVTDVSLSFTEPNNEQKFGISYAPSCSTLSSTDTCVITLTPNSEALSLSGSKVGYVISAYSGTTKITSDESTFTMKTLNLSSSLDSIGAGFSDVLTVSNDSGISIDLTGAQFSSSDGSLSFSNNTCSGTLSNESSCTVDLSVSNSASSANAEISMRNATGITLLTDTVPIVRPVITASPSAISLTPNDSQSISIMNTSPVVVTGISVALPSLTDVSVTQNTCSDISSLSASGGSCMITFQSGTAPDGDGIIEVNADNADSVSSNISASTPLLLSASLSQNHITTNSFANKQMILTLQNNSSTVTINNLSLTIGVTDLSEISYLSSCANLYSNILPPGVSCQYVLDYTPDEITIPSVETGDIQISGDGMQSVSKSVSFSNYADFYNAPQNTQLTHLGIADHTVRGVFASGSNIYAATDGGLSISTDSGSTWSNKTTADGLGNNRVWGVFVSGSNIYAATDGGLSISTDSGSTWSNKTTADGLGNNQVRSVFASGSNIYAATRGGLSISTDSGSTWSNKTTADGLVNNFGSDVFASGSNIYAATYGGLSISTDSGSTWSNKTTEDGLGSNHVIRVFASGSNIYAATLGGLSISTDSGSTWSNKTTADGLGSNSVYSVFASGSNIYAATDGGLSISKDNL